MCYGCALAESKEMDKGNIKMWCSFCREPINIPYEKLLLQYKKRMKSNDSEAFYELGIRYRVTGEPVYHRIILKLSNYGNGGLSLDQAMLITRLL